VLVDVKAVLVFGEGSDELRLGLLKSLKIDDFVIRWADLVSGFRQ